MIYKFRAECQHDIDQFCVAAVLAGLKRSIGAIVVTTHLGYPDVTCVFKSRLTLAQLVKFMRGIPDGHVMAETIQPEKTYTGERIQNR